MNMKVGINAVFLEQNLLVNEMQQKIKTTANNVVKTNIKVQLELLLKKRDFLTLCWKGYIPKNHHNFLKSLPVVSTKRNDDIPQLILWMNIILRTNSWLVVYYQQ